MGNLQCFSDFYCQELKLVIEIDGHIHDFRYVEDKNRQNQMEKYGLTFIRFSNEEIKTSMFSVVLSLESKIEELKREKYIVVVLLDIIQKNAFTFYRNLRA